MKIGINETETLIAVIAAMAIEGRIEELSMDPVKPKPRRQSVMRAWGYIQGTNAWRYGEEAFGMLSGESEEAITYWSWYTTLAIDLGDLVRKRAAEWNVILPQL